MSSVSSSPSSSQRMTRLILVRHGQTEANVNHILQGHSDGVLTAIGEQQANELAVQMRNFHIDQIVSSDLSRARRTAELISTHTSAALIISPLAREWNVGDLDGQPAQALVDAFRRTNLPEAEFRPDKGESLNELRDRTKKFLKDILTRYSDQTTVVVSHGDFLRMVLSVLINLNLEDALSYHLDNASYTVLDQVEKGGWQITKLNVSEHLS